MVVFAEKTTMKNLIFFLFVAFGFLGQCRSIYSPPSYEAIFNFGDSLSDTGNYVGIHGPLVKVLDKYPYGETFFKNATGRFCDGRVILDFIAEAYGLPYVPPYMDVVNRKIQNISQGVNFAVGGATALDAEFIVSKRRGKIATIESLSVQLGWFKKLKPSLCSNEQDCATLFKKSLFIVGEIGGNDIGLASNTTAEAREIIPLIVEAITNATRTLIEEGAVHLLVPGNFPMGCTAAAINMWKNSSTEKDYDSRGCLKPGNDLVEYQNKEIKLALSELKRKYPHVKITYADYYGAAKQIFDAPQKYGFIEMLKPCLVPLDKNLCNVTADSSKTYCELCKNPATYINWDGAHYTEAAYRIIAQGLIEGPFSHPPLKHTLS